MIRIVLVHTYFNSIFLVRTVKAPRRGTTIASPSEAREVKLDEYLFNYYRAASRMMSFFNRSKSTEKLFLDYRNTFLVSSSSSSCLEEERSKGDRDRKLIE